MTTARARDGEGANSTCRSENIGHRPPSKGVVARGGGRQASTVQGEPRSPQDEGVGGEGPIERES